MTIEFTVPYPARTALTPTGREITTTSGQRTPRKQNMRNIGRMWLKETGTPTLRTRKSGHGV